MRPDLLWRRGEVFLEGTINGARKETDMCHPSEEVAYEVILWTVDRGSPKLNLTSLQAARIEVGVYTHDCQLVTCQAPAFSQSIEPVWMEGQRTALVYLRLTSTSTLHTDFRMTRVGDYKLLPGTLPGAPGDAQDYESWMWGVIMLAVVALVLLITGAVFIFYRSLMPRRRFYYGSHMNQGSQFAIIQPGQQGPQRPPECL
jgi:hypothetical protein